MLKILLVEDCKQVADIIFEYFEALDYELDYAATGTLGLKLAEQYTFDVIILDVMLPGIDGIGICQTLRANGNNTPIIMLTARDTQQDELLGLSTGADDYIVKPFDLSLLEARVNALYRRANQGRFSNNELAIGPLTLKRDERLVYSEGQPIKLNPSCYKILLCLMDNYPNVVTKPTIEAVLWPDDLPDQDILRKHIYLLRSKLNQYFDSEIIITIPKVGYKLHVE